MRLSAFLRRFSFVPPLLCSCSAAFALIKFNDGHDEIFVTGTAGMSYDSNIFTNAGGSGDTSYNATLDLEYARKAGMIGVDANLGWLFSRFSRFTGENFANPQFNLELTKDSGRTTGDLHFGAKRENRAETAINLRTESWNYDAALHLKYPVIQRYSISGGVDYNRRDFSNNATLVDINTYGVSTDLFYALTSQRDLLVGYRYRQTDTTADTIDRDHAVTVGVNGKIISKLNGSLRVGLQRRTIDRRARADESHNSFTASGSTTWTVSQRFSLSGTLSRDFVTVATDVSVDTTSAGLDAQYAINSKTAAFGGVTYTHLKFLDTGSGGRTDDSVGWSAGLAYTFNDHLKVTASYSYLNNWSTLAFSDYHRHSVSLNVSSRW